MNDNNWRNVIAACGPVQPSTAPVVESSVRNPWSTRRMNTSPATIFDDDAIATRWSAEKVPYIFSKRLTPCAS